MIIDVCCDERNVIIGSVEVCFHGKQESSAELKKNEEQKENILYVETFGGFTMTWNGRKIGNAPKERDSQMIRLLQAVIHSGKEGFRRQQLEETLFEDREIDDVSHGIRTIVYNTKKRLAKEGLPEVNFIETHDGHYYWTDQIEVVEDAHEFEKKYNEAEAEKDPDVRLRLYLEAVDYYTGEFLPLQTQMIWVAQEDRHYREIFEKCVNNAAALLRMNKDYNQLESLGDYAARVQPLMEWETLKMEALIALGRDEEARRLYEETESYYMDELGFKPTFSTVELLDRLGNQLEHQYALLDEIQEALSGAKLDMPGGFFCSYPVFQGIYRMIERMTERGGQSIYIMLCTIVDRQGVPMRECQALERLSQKLGDAICHSVRRSDAICRYGKGQYLTLLVNTTREDCSIVQKRINRHFLSGTQRAGVEYFINSVILSPEGKVM